MKKITFLFLSTSCFYFLNAQKNDINLKTFFEQEKNKTEKQFDLLVQKGTFKSKLSDSLKSRLAFVFDNRPYFLSETDSIQIQNGNVDFLQNGQLNGLNGSFNGNDINIFIFDGGRVYPNHVDFGGTPTTPSSRITNLEGTNVPYSGHATGVTSMMGGIGHNLSAQGSNTVAGNTKGMAPLATFNSYSFATTTLPGQSQTSNVFQKIQSSLPALSNHSYGNNPGWNYGTEAQGYPADGFYWGGYYNAGTSMDFNGSYYVNDRNYDNLVRQNPQMIIVKSSGNSYGTGPTLAPNLPTYYNNGTDWVEFSATDTLPADNCSTTFDCIGPGSLAKNIIVVGSTEKISSNNNRYTTATDVVKSGFSSVGPRDDGAIKPDIVGVGSNIFSASSTSQGSNSWTVGSGTSYSAPQVTGIIGLWNEINKTLFNNTLLNAAKGKTLLIHSAAEAGNTPGPDAWYGWGFADAKKGAELLIGKSNGTVFFDELTLNNSQNFVKDVVSDGNTPLKVTISWVDPAFTTTGTTWNQLYNNTTSKLINDLDLRITDLVTNEVVEPWKLTLSNLAGGAVRGDNLVDNVEQVIIDSPVAGRAYRITVNHKGTLQGGNSQNFAIISTGQTAESLATKEDKISAEVKVYPTLVKEEINVSIPMKADKLSIIDMSGKLLRSLKTSSSMKLNVKDLTSGVYYIVIETESGKVSKRFIKE